MASLGTTPLVRLIACFIPCWSLISAPLVFLSAAMTNLCRDEVTSVVKDKIEAVFGSSFNTNGLGAVLTCGVTGMGAGLSHSPTCNVSQD